MTSSPEIIDEIAVRMELVNACALAGSRESFAAAHGLGRAYLSDVIRGRRSPCAVILKALGFEKLTRYRKTVPESLPGAYATSRPGNSPIDQGAFHSS